jgi:hypothetical protein
MKQIQIQKQPPKPTTDNREGTWPDWSGDHR